VKYFVSVIVLFMHQLIFFTLYKFYQKKRKGKERRKAHYTSMSWIEEKEELKLGTSTTLI